MKVDVRFADRRDVLNAYWGYLSGGGLIITDDELHEGEQVDLHVFIEASHHDYELAGKVVRRQAEHAVIAFDAGASHNTLLNAALCDSDVELEALIVDDMSADEAAVRVFSLSEQGCCLRLESLSAEPFGVGTEITVCADKLRIEGCVVWANGSDRCVMFGLEDDDAGRDELASYVKSLQS